MPQNKKSKSLTDIASDKAISLAAGAMKKTITKGVTGALAGLALNHAKKRITASLAKSAKEAVIDKVISKENRESLSKVSDHATAYFQKKKEEFLGNKQSSPTTAEKTEKVEQKNQGEATTMNSVNETTNFAAFITYVVTDKKYQDKLGDCAIISFLATKCAKNDIVLGKAPEWEQIIQQARLLEGSEVTAKNSKKLTKGMVEMHFGKELAHDFGEHFGVNTVKKLPELQTKRAAVKTVPVKTTRTRTIK